MNKIYNKEFIGLQKIYFRYLVGSFLTKISIFRLFQNIFVKKQSTRLKGTIIECGSSQHNNYKSYFSDYLDYKISNIDGDYDIYLDITDTKLESNSVDGLILISVIEHVYDTKRAIKEIHRILKPGGRAIITVPVMCSIHGNEDYWRINIQGIEKLFKEFSIVHFSILGGIYSSIFNALQRPKGNLRKRFFINKILAIPFFVIGKLFDTYDDFPLGYGFVIEKNE